MDTLRARLETFWGEREATRLEQHARGDARFDLREVYRRFEDLSAGERLDETAGWLEEETLASRQDGPRRLLALSRSIVLDAASAERAFAAAEAGIDPERRRDLLDRAFVHWGEACARLGFGTAGDYFVSRFPAARLGAWRSSAEAVLERTAGSYRDALHEHAARADLNVATLSFSELQSLSRWSALEARFEPAGVVAALGFLAAGLGIVPDRLSALAFRDAEGPGIACFAPRVPEAIVVSMGNVAGPARYRAGLAAGGIGISTAFTSPELPVERRIAPDPGLRQGWGFLFADNLAEEAWLQEFVGQRAADFAREVACWELIALRHAAASLVFELDLAALPCGSEPGAAIEAFADGIRESRGVSIDPRLAIPVHALELPSLHWLRGRAFASQLRDFLRHEFGRSFWRERRCGDLLKELWQTGTTYSAEQLTDELGFGPLVLDPQFDPG